MKRLLAIILIICLVFTACGKKENVNNSVDNSGGIAPTTNPDKIQEQNNEPTQEGKNEQLNEPISEDEKKVYTDEELDEMTKQYYLDKVYWQITDTVTSGKIQLVDFVCCEMGSEQAREYFPFADVGEDFQTHPYCVYISLLVPNLDEFTDYKTWRAPKDYAENTVSFEIIYDGDTDTIVYSKRSQKFIYKGEEYYILSRCFGSDEPLTANRFKLYNKTFFKCNYYVDREQVGLYNTYDKYVNVIEWKSDGADTTVNFNTEPITIKVSDCEKSAITGAEDSPIIWRTIYSMGTTQSLRSLSISMSADFKPLYENINMEDIASIELTGLPDGITYEIIDDTIETLTHRKYFEFEISAIHYDEPPLSYDCSTNKLADKAEDMAFDLLRKSANEAQYYLVMKDGTKYKLETDKFFDID